MTDQFMCGTCATHEAREKGNKDRPENGMLHKCSAPGKCKHSNDFCMIPKPAVHKAFEKAFGLALGDAAPTPAPDQPTFPTGGHRHSIHDISTGNGDLYNDMANMLNTVNALSSDINVLRSEHMSTRSIALQTETKVNVLDSRAPLTDTRLGALEAKELSGAWGLERVCNCKTSAAEGSAHIYRSGICLYAHPVA